MTEISITPDGHETRQEVARQACERAGITWPSTILLEGTSLVSSGEAALKGARNRWRSLPDAKTAVPLVTEALASEDRRDFAVTLAKLRLREADGRVSSLEGLNAQAPGLGYTPHAFRQLAQQVPGLSAKDAPRGMTSALLYLTDAERARIVNARIVKAPGELTLRTKVSHDGKRFMRAGLTSRYADVNDIHVAQAIELALNGRGATTKLEYRPGDSKSQFELIFPSELPIKTFRVGDVHYAAILVRNSETGEGSIEVESAVIRAACSNLTLSTGKGITQRMIHVGDSENLRNKLRAALMAAEAQLMPLVAQIQKNAETPLEYQAGDIIEKLAKALQVGTGRARDWKDTFEHRYLPEAGSTVWSLTAAITEAAQRADNWVAGLREEKIAARITAENGLAWLGRVSAKEFE